MTIFKRTAVAALFGMIAQICIAPANAQDESGQGGADSGPDDVIVVRGVNIPDEKRATSEISSLLDEASFQRTGDTDIGSALARVTGLSLSQGKFIIVRGLNERYSNVTINGSPLPSPEPLQRVAPLDIIPTAILSGSLVQKTFSPEYSAEFGGGLVELRTKAIPRERFFEIGGSIGLNQDTTFKNGLSYDGGKRDWLGFDDGTRNYSTELASILTMGTNGLSSAQQNALDVSIENHKTLLITSNDIPPDYSFDIAGGDRVDLTDTISLGATMAAGVRTVWKTRNGRREQGLISSADFSNEGEVLDFNSTDETVETHAISTIGADIGDNHKFAFTNFILRSTNKEARISEGQAGDSGTDFILTNTQFLERQVWQTQARGDHFFPALADLSATWRFAYGEAFRDSPYERQNSFIRPQGSSSPFSYDFLRVTGELSQSVTFSKIEDANIDSGADFQLPFTLFGQSDTLKFGYAYTEKDRDTLLRQFRYKTSNATDLAPLRFSRIDLIYSDAVLATDLIDLDLVGGSLFHDNTSSKLQVNAAYVGLDLAAGPYMRIAAGGRFEDSSEVTQSFATTAPAASFSESRIEENYFLPAATVTWNPLDDIQVRAGFSKTITRPQFRELSPSFFVDEDANQVVIGNPFLVNSEIDNYDARIEYYFGRRQFVTIGGFYKKIDKPIEDANVLSLGGLVFESFINAPSAKLFGLEFEFEKTFPIDGIVDWKAFASKDLVFKTNYTFTQSDVSAEGVVTTAQVLSGAPVARNVLPGANFITDGRSLQGQSDHLFNLQLGVEDMERDARATFLVNWASKRIRQVESFRSGVVTPAVVEQPPVLLDFVFSHGFEKWGGEWEIGFKVENILGDDYKATQSFPDNTVGIFDAYNLGRKISLSLKRRL